jgi:hypothetical protein
VPVDTSQLTDCWHWDGAGQSAATLQEHATLPAVQRPAWQMSSVVHARPSSHGVPSVFLGSVHAPVAVSHAPTSWQLSSALHTTGLLPAHAPAAQVSVSVQALPSLQDTPSDLFT